MRPQLLTGARLGDGTAADVLIDADGLVGDPAAAEQPDVDTVDLAGHVLLRAAVEPHAHLDKAFLSEVVPNPTGDLIGAIEAMRASRHLLTVPETIRRAERAARLLASNGFVAVRTHADVTVEHGLTSVEALTEVRRRVADVIDVEIVALTGWPLSGPAGSDHRALLRAALDAGADVVGGCPHLEPLGGDGTIEAATQVLLDIAVEYGRPVDLHTDETLDPTADGLDRLAAHVRSGFDLPVTASHCVSLGQRSAADQQSTAEQVSNAGIGVVTLPHTNLFLQGRGRAPMPRALTAVEALRDAGVVVAAGADNLQDPFNPMGRACAFETAGLMVLAAHLLPADAWDLVSRDAGRVLGRPVGSGSVPEVGEPADLLAIRADTVREAVAFAPGERSVWKHGRRLTS